MKRIYYLLLVIVIAGISFKCQKELSGGYSTTAQANSQSAPITSTLQGNVQDENGQPLAGVLVSAGSKTTTTNSRGYFRIADALLDKNSSLATANQPGYFKAYRSFRATAGVNQLVIQLIKKTLAGTINAATGGNVSMANGAKVSLPANGVTKASGGAYAGNIQVYAASIDPTSRDIGKTVPGSFMGDDKDKNRVVLSSYGMLAVELESSAGEKLQIAAANEATLTFPIPSSIMSSAPASISLWYVDEQSGIWKEQGTAKKNGGSYTGSVKHFSFWNCDISVPAISFSATFKTADNLPLATANVRIRVDDDTSRGYTHGFTDTLGQVSGLVPANQKLVLEVLDQCYNVVYTKNIGPFTTNTDLGTVLISNDAPSLFILKGRLVSCSNTPVTNGYAMVFWNNYVTYLDVDAKGEFLMKFFNCYGAPQNCEIIGVDKIGQQQGAVQTISFTGQVTNTGDISACGNATAQFLNYTLDGVDYFLPNSANDSLFVYNDSINGGKNLYVYGSHSPENQLNFNFAVNAGAGVYALNSLSVNNYNRIKLSRPFNITITGFPQRTGEFYEGNFSGSFIDSSALTVTHTINCSFHIKNY